MYFCQLNFQTTAWVSRGQENDEGHVFHAESFHPHRQHGRESCGDAGDADKIAGADKRIDPADEAGEHDGCETNLDRVVGHQRDAHGQGNRHCAGYDPGLDIAGKILTLKSGCC